MIKINTDLCNGCGDCVEKCPGDTFLINKKTGKAYIAGDWQCMECQLCLNLCKAIYNDKKQIRIKRHLLRGDNCRYKYYEKI